MKSFPNWHWTLQLATAMVVVFPIGAIEAYADRNGQGMLFASGAIIMLLTTIGLLISFVWAVKEAFLPSGRKKDEQFREAETAKLNRLH